MARYLFVYRSDENTFDTMPPDDIQRFNEKWRVWIADGTQHGWMLDASKALKTEGCVVTADSKTDGPYVEGNDVVRGYVKVQADTLDAAAELARGCPVLQHGGRVEVRPFFESHPGA
jgi:hypothetical protein